jgi:hypothetical protein
LTAVIFLVVLPLVHVIEVFFAAIGLAEALGVGVAATGAGIYPD